MLNADRWNRWSRVCPRFWIRLEDCTGESLWTLPQDDEYEDESEDESGDERSDDDYDDSDDDDDSGEWVTEPDEEEPEWGPEGFHACWNLKNVG